MDLNTDYGVLTGIKGAVFYSDGKLKECMTDEKNIIKMPFGEVVPLFSKSDARTKYRNSLAFYNTGKLKSIYLEDAVKVPTKYGEISAELLTFYGDGSIHRIFPLYGQISGYWTEENEYDMAEKVSYNFGGLALENKLSGLCFYESGKIKSITLYPKETVDVYINDFKAKARLGISFYESGSIKSFEPAFPLELNTPFGKCLAYDIDPLGISGDTNSLSFYEDSRLKDITTSTDKVEIVRENKDKIIIKPEKVSSLLNPEKTVIMPIKLNFYGESCMIEDSFGNIINASADADKIKILPGVFEFGSEDCIGECDSCDKCSF